MAQHGSQHLKNQLSARGTLPSCLVNTPAHGQAHGHTHGRREGTSAQHPGLVGVGTQSHKLHQG